MVYWIIDPLCCNAGVYPLTSGATLSVYLLLAYLLGYSCDVLGLHVLMFVGVVPDRSHIRF